MMLWPLAWMLGVSGFAALAAAMPRHARQIGPGALPSQPALRAVAAAALGTGIAICIESWGIARGVPIAIGLGSLSAIMVGLLLAMAPGRLIVAALRLPLLTLLIASCV